MTRGFLFGGNTSSQGQNKYLVEFKAGKMTLKGKMVHPDKRKGLVYVHQSDDSLMHFCWKDRTSGAVEDDFIIFPEDVEFKRVSQCTTGRVYVLKFKSINRRCFYWLQEPKTDKDEEHCNKINEYLNNPPIPGSTRGGLGSSLSASGSSQSSGNLHSEIVDNINDENLQNLLNNMNQHQLMQLLGGIGGISGMANLSSLLGSGSRPSSQQSSSSATTASKPASEKPPAATTTSQATPTTAASTVTTAAGTTGNTTTTTAATAAAATTTTTSAQDNVSSIQLSDLQTILSGLNVAQSKEGGAQAGVSVDLSSAITAESLQPLLANEELMNRIQTLLPPTESGVPVNLTENFKQTVQSPQFQQALSIFSAALQSGQLGPLMQQFEMSADVVAAASSGDMVAFVKALQSSDKDAPEEGAKKDEKKEEQKKKKDDSDEDMALD